MKRKSYVTIVAAIIAAANTVAAQDSLFHIFSATAPRSTTSQSLAGAGTAMLQDGFGGLLNPAFTTASLSYGGAGGIFAAGYWNDPAFDKLALPIGAVLADKGGGAMGFFYRYLSGEHVTVHDMVVNLAGRMFGQSDTQGPVDFGMNFRYEHSVWRRDYQTPVFDDTQGGDDMTLYETRTADFRSRNFLMDIGFYQTNIMPGLDFSLVVNNLTGYRWNDIDGEDEESGWLSGQYRTITIGALYTLPIPINEVVLMIPLDVEMANLFVKSVPNKYVLRAGVDVRIMNMYSVRFGYAHAPEDPVDIFTDFDHKNLFFGGVGVSVRPVHLDLFIGKDTFGATATYYY